MGVAVAFVSRPPRVNPAYAPVRHLFTPLDYVCGIATAQFTQTGFSTGSVQLIGKRYETLASGE